MKNKFQKIISMVLVLCTVFTTGIIGSVISASAASYAMFSEENSYLTLEEYQSLNLDVYTDSSINTKSMEHIDGFKYMGVEYGWSNPQVLAVLASAPYWSELNYGSEIDSPGSTSITVSSSTTQSTSTNLSVELGISITSSVNAAVAGNGVEQGISVKAAFSAAETFQKENTFGTSQTFTAGAGDDHVVLMTLPVASFKYEYNNSKGEPEYMYVNVQLDPVYGMVSLDTYNTVAKSHNHLETCEERMMPVIELDNIIEHYEVGDPTTCLTDVSQIPTTLSFVYGDMSDCVTTDETVGNQVSGTVYTTDKYSSIGVSNTCMDQTISLSESQGKTIECGVMLGGSLYREVSVGCDIAVLNVGGKLRGEISGEVGLSTSYTTINTSGLDCSMSFASLPTSANTGVNSMGIGTTPYSFNTKLAVWIPDNVGENVCCAPIFVLPIVKFDSHKTLPPELPGEFYAESVTETSVTFKFTTGCSTYSKRLPEKYQIMVKTTGNVTDNYVLLEEIDASYYLYEITGLEPDTEYTFAIKSVASDGTESVLSTPLTIKTSSEKCPVIEQQPQTMRVDEGDEPIFTVVPQGDIDDYCYQWYQMTENRYGYEWTPVSGATKNTFNPAYFSVDGKVSDVNRSILDETAYRCVITDKTTGVSVVSDTVVLYISDACLIESYTELKEIAYKISIGDTDYIYRDYILGCDIVFPEGEVWTVPFGTTQYPYQGEFDGRGHTISGFTFNNTNCEYSGFFGQTKNAEIKNLTIKDSTVIGGTYTGTFVGRTVNTFIDDCYVTGNTVVSGTYEVGGFVGDTGVNSYYTNCYVQGTVKNSNVKGYTGGFAGVNYGGELTNCVCFCTIEGEGIQGGVVGLNLCRITNCFFDNTLFDGEVTGQSNMSKEVNSKGVSTEELMEMIENFSK